MSSAFRQYLIPLKEHIEHELNRLLIDYEELKDRHKSTSRKVYKDNLSKFRMANNPNAVKSLFGTEQNRRSRRYIGAIGRIERVLQRLDIDSFFFTFLMFLSTCVIISCNKFMF